MKNYLDDLRRHGADLAVAFFLELARYRTEDTCRLRVFRLFAGADYENDCVFVEADVAAIFAAHRLGLADDDGAMDLFLLYGLARLRGLDGDDDFVTDFCIALLGTAEHLEDASDGTAGVVCYFYY